MPKIWLDRYTLKEKVLYPLLEGKWLSIYKFNEYVKCLYNQKAIYVAYCLAMDFDLKTHWDQEKEMMLIDTEKLMEYLKHLKSYKGCKSIW